ncbi:MAG TPA: hypothetical protein VEF89_06450 [Solirubrobacteraceae bacterium]|nr:hypothetical protein [Solirubrobacteraceae bacterium]
MAAWDPYSVRADDPLVYRATTLPAFDQNLRNLAVKVAPTCLIAHVRGVTHSDQEMIAQTNLHPFRFQDAGTVLAHNGHLREFVRMRYELVPHIRPELRRGFRRPRTRSGSTPSCSPELEDPNGRPDARELADAAVSALRLLRQVRARHGIDTSSPVNLCLTTGQPLIATRFSFDYGWYPNEEALLETDLP